MKIIKTPVTQLVEYVRFQKLASKITGCTVAVISAISRSFPDFSLTVPNLNRLIYGICPRGEDLFDLYSDWSGIGRSGSDSHLMERLECGAFKILWSGDGKAILLALSQFPELCDEPHW